MTVAGCDPMTNVFVSYSRTDRPRAEQLAHALEVEGLSVWWDTKVPLGKTVDRVIRKALDKASCIIVLWSAASVESAWVKDEARVGLHRGVLVPVRIDDVPIPLGFGGSQTANLVGWEGDPSHPELLRVRHSIQGLLTRQDTLHTTLPFVPGAGPRSPKARPRPPVGPPRKSPYRPRPKLPVTPRSRSPQRSSRRARLPRRGLRAWVLLSAWIGILAYGLGSGRLDHIHVDTCSEDLADLARGGLSLAASYGEIAESTIRVKATELVRWLEERLGGSGAAEPREPTGTS